MRSLQVALILFTAVFQPLTGQVGIGTTNPSMAAMLEVSSSTGINRFFGLMPPRVEDYDQRDLITSGSTDAGLLIFVQGTGEFQIWNGIYWETIYSLQTQIQNVAQQDFDSELSWGYSVNPVFYSVPPDHWNILQDLGSGTLEIDRVNDNFLGCRDLNNLNGGGNFFHEIIFDNVDISGLTNPRISFDYDVFEFDNGDDVRYEVFYDGTGQGQVLLVDGNANLVVEGTEIINIPPGINQVSLIIGIRQNGDADFAGFDNFRVYGE